MGDRLIKRLGKKNVFLSHTCNRLADTFAGRTLDQVTKTYVDQIDDVLKSKESELLEV